MKGLLKRLTVPNLDIEYHEDRIVVKALTKDGMEDIDPIDDLMFLANIYDGWKEGPIWLDAMGEECRENRWTKDTDTGWIHYFNDVWTRKQRDAIFIDYFLVCCPYGQPPIVFHPSGVILCLKESHIVLGEKILYTFEPGTDEDDLYWEYRIWAKRYVKAYVKKE
jgi:hypothetical protein